MMNENEFEIMEVRKFSHNSWINVVKQWRLLWVGYTEAQVDGEKNEAGKIKPLALKVTAKKDADGTPYLRIEKSEKDVKQERTISKPAVEIAKDVKVEVVTEEAV